MLMHLMFVPPEVFPESSLKNNDFKQSHSKNILLTRQVVFIPDT